MSDAVIPAVQQRVNLIASRSLAWDIHGWLVMMMMASRSVQYQAGGTWPAALFSTFVPRENYDTVMMMLATSSATIYVIFVIFGSRDSSRMSRLSSSDSVAQFILYIYLFLVVNKSPVI